MFNNSHMLHKSRTASYLAMRHIWHDTGSFVDDVIMDNALLIWCLCYIGIMLQQVAIHFQCMIARRCYTGTVAANCTLG